MKVKYDLFLAMVEVMTLVMLGQQDCLWHEFILMSSKLLGVWYMI